MNNYRTVVASFSLEECEILHQQFKEYEKKGICPDNLLRQKTEAYMTEFLDNSSYFFTTADRIISEIWRRFALSSLEGTEPETNRAENLDDIAELIASRTREIIATVSPVKDKSGLSIEHAAWMLDNLPNDIDKKSRWIGYAQALLVFNDKETLENLRETTRSVIEEANIAPMVKSEANRKFDVFVPYDPENDIIYKNAVGSSFAKAGINLESITADIDIQLRAKMVPAVLEISSKTLSNAKAGPAALIIDPETQKKA